MTAAETTFTVNPAAQAFGQFAGEPIGLPIIQEVRRYADGDIRFTVTMAEVFAAAAPLRAFVDGTEYPIQPREDQDHVYATGAIASAAWVVGPNSLEGAVRSKRLIVCRQDTD